MNKNSNTYQILYAAVMVVLVGAVLALIYMALKPKQDLNRANDTRQQILSALQITVDDESKIESTFNEKILQELIVDAEGNIVDSADNCAFDIKMKANTKLPAKERKLPVFKATGNDGKVKYVIPAYGAGLWGPIWGYVAVNDDGNTIYGANFSHESETPGLGAKITEEPFTSLFREKHLYVDNEFKGVEVVKTGQKSISGAETVNAISGATITSRGVSTMLQDCLTPYDPFLKKLQTK